MTGTGKTPPHHDMSLRAQREIPLTILTKSLSVNQIQPPPLRIQHFIEPQQGQLATNHLKTPRKPRFNFDTKGKNADLRRHSRFRFHPPPVRVEPYQADQSEENANDQSDRGNRQ